MFLFRFFLGGFFFFWRPPPRPSLPAKSDSVKSSVTAGIESKGRKTKKKTKEKRVVGFTPLSGDGRSCSEEKTVEICFFFLKKMILVSSSRSFVETPPLQNLSDFFTKKKENLVLLKIVNKKTQ